MPSVNGMEWWITLSIWLSMRSASSVVQRRSTKPSLQCPGTSPVQSSFLFGRGGSIWPRNMRRASCNKTHEDCNQPNGPSSRTPLGTFFAGTRLWGYQWVARWVNSRMPGINPQKKTRWQDIATSNVKQKIGHFQSLIFQSEGFLAWVPQIIQVIRPWLGIETHGDSAINPARRSIEADHIRSHMMLTWIGCRGTMPWLSSNGTGFCGKLTLWLFNIAMV
jgi:hypothetical protein